MRRWTRSSGESGAAVVDFVLVSLVLLPLFLGLVQVGLVLYVRTSAAAAATEGARFAARLDQAPADGVVRARSQLDGVISDRFIEGIEARDTFLDGWGVCEVVVRVRVPPLGLWGPGVGLTVAGHGIREIGP
ncbi:MAG: pilus assembly protein [Propionibacteriales bacterium]|nr:pilus assembly protein [Propionibacteriales bacterium]